MANLSDLTRKEQVLVYLTERVNTWVDGPELATESVGGSEGLRRLRELRMEGKFDIRERRHPDAHRDIHQYMLVVIPKAEWAPVERPVDHTAFGPNSKTYLIPPLDLGSDLLDAADNARPAYPTHATEAARREEEAAARLLDPPEPEPAESPWPADHGQTRMSSAVKRKEDGTFEYVPPQRPLVEQLETPPDPPQPEGIMFDRLPAKIRWGEMAVCPRCRMKTTRGRKTKPKEDEGGHIAQRKSKSKDDGPALVDSDGVLLYRDPNSRKPKPCERCNGYGIVPNVGPIPYTPPTGPVASDPEPEAVPMELDL